MYRATTIGALVLLATWSVSMGETVVLQQGDTYKGCLTRTAVGLGNRPISSTAPATAPAATQPGSLPATMKANLVEDGALQVRGTQNHLLIRFDLPEDLKAKKLARARLEVFVPQPTRLNKICEIHCRQVTQDWAGSYDVMTDYRNGRPPGVVDSYSLWEYNGKDFPHRYRSLAVPQEGKWIDFNVTPLVRKWLAQPAGNLGVALIPVDLPDKRFPNVSLLDMPSATSDDQQHRPRLVLEFEPLDRPYLVGMTHTLEKYCDRDTWTRFFGPFREEYELCMARNEFEGFQVLVYPMLEPLKGVTFEWTDLVADGGARIAKGDIAYNLQEVVRLFPSARVRDVYFHGRSFDVPDVLSTARPADLPVHQSTPFWFTVHTRPETKPGRYKGAVTIRCANAPPRALALTVKVWNYAIPEKWNFQTMGQTIWSNVSKAHGQLTPELRRKYLDLLLDHRFNPTEQYANVVSPAPEELEYCLRRGANSIYLSGNYRGDAAQLKERYDQVRKLGLIDQALVYIGDETNDWAEMRRRSDSIRRACPELMIMIGGSYPRAELDGVIDIFDPEIDTTTGVFNMTADRLAPLVAKSQAKGERFFWYVCVGPYLPCPNVQLEEPLIASRVLFWITWKFGVTGFEYYCYNIGWENNLPADGKRWPERPFTAQAFKDTNGDGNLFYPGPEGPFSSIRFENIRDGIEDWESHFVLRECVEALEAKAAGDPNLAEQAKPLLKKARAVLAVPDEVTPMDFVSWTWEPAVLLKARQNLGDTIDELSKLVSEQEILAVREARQKAQLQRQREMLKARAASAATQPAPPTQPGK